MTGPGDGPPFPGPPFPPPGFLPFPPPFLLGQPEADGEFPPFPLPGTLPPFRPPDEALPMASTGAITVVSQLFRRWTDRQSEQEWGISGPRLHVLSLLANAGPLTMSNLAAILHVTPRAITRLVDGLELQGYVSRVTDPTDRRKHEVSCTAEGRLIATSFLPTQLDRVNQLFDGISTDRLRTFVEVITELGDRIGNELWPKPEDEIQRDEETS